MNESKYSVVGQFRAYRALRSGEIVSGIVECEAWPGDYGYEVGFNGSWYTICTADGMQVRVPA